jgi:ribosomal RNA assembly protein
VDKTEMTSNFRVRIPNERIGVLIGQDGSVKKKMEAICRVNLNIDSETGEVEIISEKDVKDPTLILKIQNIILAIGRGFSPERALKLLEDDVMLDVLDLRDFVGKSRENIQRIKGRIIGKDGKTRRIIEETTNVYVSIYGHTVSLVGRVGELEIARNAIQKLIDGCQHKTVYRFLYRMRQEIKKERMKLWEDQG